MYVSFSTQNWYINVMAEDEAKKPKIVKTKHQLITFDVARLAVILIILVGGTAWAIVKVSNADSLPKKVYKQAHFAIYYPTPIPAGYMLDKNSAQFDKNVLFFSFSNMGKKVFVSEQAAPSAPPDLSAIQKVNTSFKKVDTAIGQVIMGLNPASQVPLAIIETNTTLINISGSKDTPSEVINKMAQSLTSLQE
jgi:hypothetical protein